MSPFKSILAASLVAAVAAPAAAHDTCETTARIQKQAAASALKHDLLRNIAVCINADRSERLECLLESVIEYAEGTSTLR